MVIIRSEREGDRKDLAFVNSLAFNQVNEAKLVAEIRESENFIPELSIVAEVNGVIVGHILLSYVELVGEETSKVLALAPMAVLPEYQRQGIGSSLVRVGLEKADNRKEKLVVVLGHPKFYPRFGFQPAINYGIYCPFSVPSEAFLVKPLINYHPSMQGKIKYPPTFNEV